MKSNKRTLLVLDWGIGGLGAFKELRTKAPTLNLLYWSDSGEVPYGKMSETLLSSRILEVLDSAKKMGATEAIIACNAASTVLPLIHPPIPTIGVIVKGVEKLIVEKNADDPKTHIGVIGGRRTIESGAWSQPLIEEGFKLSSKIAQPLSAIIEKGLHDERSSKPTFERILSGLDNVSDLVLACTHYIAAENIISSILPNATIFDPVQECVDFIVRHWIKDEIDGQGSSRFLTTGDIKEMEKSAKLAFGLNITGQVCAVKNSK